MIFRRRPRHGPPLRFAMPRWPRESAHDPYGSVLALDPRRRDLLSAALATLVILGGLLALTSQTKLVRPPPEKREIPVIVAQRPPEPIPSPPVPVTEHPASPRPPQPRRASPPAQAAQVLTRTEQPSAPADFTDFAIATGHAEAFAGGYTAGNGTSHNAVTNPASARKPVAAARPGSLARQAEPVRKDWACGWPDEAIDSDLRETRVAVRVAVSKDGEANAAQVQGGALPGFVEAARRCALDEQYRPALDPEGHRVPGETGLLVVHFVR